MAIGKVRLSTSVSIRQVITTVTSMHCLIMRKSKFLFLNSSYFSCEFKKNQKTIYDNSDPAIAKNRLPMAVYCKYKVDHVFNTVEECQDHMKECPFKEEHQRKMEQCHRKFTQNKAWIKAAQNAKKEKEVELGGNINAPASQVMPNLRY